MGAYLTQISKIPLLTAGQERALAQRITAGLSAAQRLRRTEELTEELCPRRRQDLHCSVRDGEHAKIDLVEAHLCLVVSVANATPALACRCWI